MTNIIGVDVDLTVADSDVSHWDWLRKIGTRDSSVGEELDWEDGELWDYDLGKYFHMPIGVDSMDYWRLSDIYDEKPCETPLAVVHQVYTRPIQPLQDSQRVLSKLRDMGWEIVFISHIKGNHHKSKVEWLKRHFPFMDGFVATKEKYYANSCFDVFVDDRNKHIMQSKASVNIKFQTPYTQDVELEDNHVDFVAGGWSEIENYLKEIYD
jgi:5'(3')-deoxyribonucleotidase